MPLTLALSRTILYRTMSEQIVQSIGQASKFERFNRRVFSKRTAAGLGCLAVGVGAAEIGTPLATSQYEKYSSSFGGNYAKDYWDFLKEIGAESMDGKALDELLRDSPDNESLYMQRVDKEYQSDPEALAEYDLVLEDDGPVSLDFDGLHGSNVELNILRAVVDDEEQFLIPLIRDDIN